MTTLAPPKSPPAAVPLPALLSDADVAGTGARDAEPKGAIRLRLAPLGIDFRAPRFSGVLY